MNHCYRLVFNAHANTWQAVAETAKSHCTKSLSTSAVVLLSSLLMFNQAWAETNANILPTGGQVISGQSSISQTGNSLNIQQTTQQSIINWNTFNIGAAAQVNYLMPGSNAISLNRVISTDPSAIFGKLNANGQVWLINPNGVLFGQGAQVNVGGLLASTLNIADSDFLSGNYQLNGNTGSVVNLGNISANNGGYVALLAPEVRNEGVISALQGNVSMAAGDAITLDFDGHHLINVKVDSANLNTLVENKHLIKVGSGQVLMTTSTADNLMTSVVNNSGRIEADGLVAEAGVVRLTGAKTVMHSGEISAVSSNSKGGTVHMLGENVGVVDAGSINVSGKTGGGTILVGGDFQGKNPNIQNANRTYVAQNAALKADATDTGDGGKVIVWADDITRYYGNISAKGGTNAGNGGFAEVSGKRLLNFFGDVDLSASQGNGGNLLLDPTDITLSTGADTNTAGFTVPGDLTEAFGDDAALNSVFNVGAGGSFAGIAAGNTITLQATNDITIANAFNIGTATGSVNNSLVLQANNNINVSAAVTATGTGSITMTANADNTGGGNITLAANNLTTAGGGINLSGVNISKTTGTINTSGSAGVNGGNITIAGTGTVGLGTGAITANGGNSAIANTVGGNAGNVSISSTTGNITAGAITANGGNAGAGTANGSNAGNITISTTGNVTTGAITARTGSATGTGASGVTSTTSINGANVTVAAINLSGQNNGNGGALSINATGSLALNGAINTSGGTAITGNAGKNAGAITLSGNTITNAAAATINANGSNGLGVNQNGGNGAAINIIGAGNLSLRAITANGGNGVATNAAGGNAGSIRVSTNTSNITTNAGALSARTGAGIGTGANSTQGFINISNTSAAGTIATGAINTSGQTNGHGGNISVSGNNNVTIAGIVSSSGGTSTGTRAGRNAGNITIIGTNRSITGATTATGGAGIGTNQAGGNAGVVAMTGTGTLNTLAITANTGNRTGSGTPATPGSVTLSGSSVTSTAISTAAGTGANGGNVNVTTTGAGTSSITSVNANNLGAINMNVADTLTISGVVAGTNSVLTKTGAGTLVLGGANTYSGATNINAGTVSATNAAALGNVGGGTTVASGATLNVNNVTLAESALTINGNGVGSAGALTGTNAGIVTGTVTTASNSTIGTTSAASSLTINGRLTAANNLGIVGLGDVTATNATNNFSTVNINGANDVNLRDTNAITLGNGASNLTGNLTVHAGANITLNNAITTTGGDITLAGVNFINNAGASGLSASGRWLVYANTHTGNTFGSLNSGNQAIWNTAYPAAVAQTGNRYVFANSPTVTVTSTNQVKTYGQDGAPIVANAYTATGFINAATFGNVFTQDTAANSLTGSATSTGAPTAANVGSYAINVTPITTTTGYTLTKNSTGQLTVNPATLTITANDQTKTYGNSLVFLNTEFTSSGLQNGEAIGSVNLSSTGAVNTANVGSYSITGSGASGGTFSTSNYNINYVDGNLTVNPAVINLTGNRTYNATNNFVTANFGTINGVLGQTLSVTGTGTVADANIGISKPLSIGSLSLANGSGQASNYTLIGGTHTGTITQATLNLNAVTDTKVYDGSTNSVGLVSATGLFGSDNVTSLTQSFASKNVLGTNGSTLNVDAGYTVNDGNGGNNYSVTTNTAVGTITPLAITGAITADNKIYDATNSATITTRTLTGVIGADDVTYIGGVATFSDKNVGSAKPVAATGLSLTGVDANNYSVNTTANTTADISKASLTLNASTDTKIYDGNTNSSGVVGVVGLLGSDSISGLSQSFDNKNAGSRTLNVNGAYTLNDGNSGGNYNITLNGAAGTISPANLSIVANNQTKTYGQTINFIGTEFTSTGLVGSETIGSVSLTSTGAINTAGVIGSPYNIVASNAAGGTFDANNYAISYNNGNLAVTSASLLVTTNNATRPQGSPNPTFTSTITGLVNGETSAVLNGTLSYTTSATNLSPVGSYNISPFGLSSDNYTITFIDGILSVTAPTTIPLLQSGLLRPNQAFNNCSTRNTSDNTIVTGLEAYQLDNIDFQPAINQPLLGEAVANNLANIGCFSI